MISLLLETEYSLLILQELRRMSGGGGKVRTSSALPKLAVKLALPRIDVDAAIRDLYRANLIQYQADGHELPASGYITVSQETKILQEHHTNWLMALEAANFASKETFALAQLSDLISDLCFEDMAVLAEGLKELSSIEANDINDAGFNVSAKYLMGSSKVLNAISKRMLQAINLPVRLHNASPKYVICAGPSDPKAILLIENPRAFENAVQSGLVKDVALICSFGFGLSYLGQNWLHSDETPEPDRPVMIVRCGEPPSLTQMLKAQDVYLWADLDIAAFDIYLSLRSAIPQLRLSKIYEAMVPMLSNPKTSHPYAKLFEKEGQNGNIRRSRSDQAMLLDNPMISLWDACLNRAVDQEAITNATILALGAFPYSGCTDRTED